MKGCFFKLIILFTFLVAIVFYVYEYHGDEIWDWGTDKLVEYAMTRVKENVEDLDASEYKDSLKVLVSDQFDKVKQMEWEKISDQTRAFFEKTEQFIEDNVIDSDEFKELKETIKEK